MRTWVVLAFLLFGLATAVTVSGGYRGYVGNLRVSVTRPGYLAATAWFILMIVARSHDRRHFDAVSDRIRARFRHYSSFVAATTAALVVLATVMRGAFVAAGADPYGYVSQAVLWRDGNPAQFQSQLALDAPWPDAQWSFCPLGYRPSHVAGLIVPTYAIGLPLQMAALGRIQDRGIWCVVPILGGWLVWLTYRLAKVICRERETACLATILTACSPVFLFQLMQPLSDVPAAAWWLFAIIAALDTPVWAALGSGLCASVAVLTRPNLLPLSVAVFGYVLSRPSPERRDIARPVAFLIGLIPALVITAAANTILYGSAFTSGYGTLSDIYHFSNWPVNISRYPRWLYQTHSAFIFAAVACFVVMLTPGARDRVALPTELRRHMYLGLSFVGILLACYVFYIPFDHWTYLRFLLPGIPVLIVLSVAAVEAIGSSVSRTVSTATLTCMAFVVPFVCVSNAVRGDAFSLRRLFIDRYVEAAKGITQSTPSEAVIVSVLQSGSARYYARRMTVRYDLIRREWFQEASKYLTARGRATYVALESTEHENFSERFGSEITSHMIPAVTVEPLGIVTLYGPLHR